MARINIEDSFWADVRFRLFENKLGRFAAAGCMLHVFKVAQCYYVPDRKPIPRDIWDLHDFPPEIIRCGLAEEVDGGIYVKGSDEQFAWLIAKTENGKKGGRPKSVLTKNNHLTLATPNLSQSYENPPTPSLTLAHNAIASKCDNVQLKTIAQNAARLERPPKFDFESLYKKYPRKQGKKQGLKTCARVVKIPEDFTRLSTAIDRFIEHHRQAKTGPEFIPYFSTFMSQWEDWLDPETGKNESLCSDGINWDYVFSKGKGTIHAG